MPHVIVKLYAGRSDAEKTRLADAISETLIRTLGSREASISVAVEEFAPEDWAEAVYRPDIAEQPARLYKKPGYDPFKDTGGGSAPRGAAGGAIGESGS